MTIDAPRSKRSRWSGRGRVVAGVAAILLVLAAVAGAYWWSHPKVLLGGTMRGAFAPQPMSAFPAHVGFTSSHRGEPETITLRDVDLDLGNNTAGFTASVAVCTPRGSGALGALMADEDVADFCSDLRPVRDGVTMRLAAERSDYFIVTLTPKQPGTAHLRRVDVSYSRGGGHLFQRGTQRLEGDVKLTVR